MRPGERIGDYTILSKIGEGGMSVVYLAERASDATRVVVKELRDQYRFNQQLIERFRREATILQDLRHPHLARVFGLLERDGKQYMIQEYLSGGSLADLLRTQKPYTEEEAIRWCCNALRAMNYAHENGIVHRDLKPSNLMLDERRKIRVIDFGIARAFGQERLTRTSDGSIGTLEYMSPEQILNPDKIDHLTDVYSMGIVLYELLTGAVPFEGPTPFAVQEKIARAAPPPLKQFGRFMTPLDPNKTAIAPELANIVYRALEKRADRRFGGCSEFAMRLDRYLTERTGTSTSKQAWKPSPRQATLAAASAVVLLLISLAIWRLSVPDTAGDATPVPYVAEGIYRETPDVNASDTRTREDQEAKIEAERQAQIKAEADRQAQLKAEADRQAQLKADADRQARIKAEADRQAQLKAEADRQARIKAEADRQAQLKAEADRQARIKTEADRQAREAEVQKQIAADEQARRNQAAATPSPRPRDDSGADSRPIVPRTLPVQPAVARPNRDEEAQRGIMDALQRYETAYDTLNVSAVRAVYPGAPDELPRIFAQYEFYRLEMICDRTEVSPDYSAAGVVCKMSHYFQPRVGRSQQQTQTQEFRLEKQGSAWVIVRIQRR
jgi:serine/threonine-protein kinase